MALAVKNPPASAGGVREWVLSLGREGLLEEGGATHASVLAWRIPIDRGAWRATVHGVTDSQIQLKQLSTAHTRAGVLRDAICIPAFEEGMNSPQISQPTQRPTGWMGVAGGM